MGVFSYFLGLFRKKSHFFTKTEKGYFHRLDFQDFWIYRIRFSGSKHKENMLVGHKVILKNGNKNGFKVHLFLEMKGANLV